MLLAAEPKVPMAAAGRGRQTSFTRAAEWHLGDATTPLATDPAPPIPSRIAESPITVAVPATDDSLSAKGRQQRSRRIQWPAGRLPPAGLHSAARAACAGGLRTWVAVPAPRASREGAGRAVGARAHAQAQLSFVAGRQAGPPERIQRPGNKISFWACSWRPFLPRPRRVRRRSSFCSQQVQQRAAARESGA